MNTKLGYKANRIYKARCLSGAMGWRTRLQNNYTSFSEFESFCRIYGLQIRLGASDDSPPELLKIWNSNPIIEGSVNPSDFRKTKD